MKKKVMAFAAVLAICGASSFCHNAAFAQAGMTTATPSLGATSSLGMVPGESVGPNGLPLSASPGVSTVPNGLTGTITVPERKQRRGVFDRCDFAGGNVRIPHDI